MDQWGDDDCQKNTYSSHKPDYLSVTEARGSRRGGRGEVGPLQGTSNWAIVEHDHQAVRPCPLPSSRGLNQIYSYEKGRLYIHCGSVKLGDGGLGHCWARAVKRSTGSHTSTTTTSPKKSKRHPWPKPSPEISPLWWMWGKGSMTEKSNRRAPSQIKLQLICFHSGFGSSSGCLSLVHLCFQGRHTVLEACRLVMGMNACRLDV